MKLSNTIALHAAGEIVRRDPKLWGRFKKFFRGRTAPEPERVHTHLTTVHLVDAVEQVLTSLGVTNAVALEVDGALLFEDREGKGDDLADMFDAFAANADEGRELQSLRLSVEHQHAGMHLSIDVLGRGVHERDEATVDVVVTARFPSSPKARAYGVAFDAFLATIHAGLVAALPDVRVSDVDLTIVDHEGAPVPLVDPSEARDEPEPDDDGVADWDSASFDTHD